MPWPAVLAALLLALPGNGWAGEPNRSPSADRNTVVYLFAGRLVANQTGANRLHRDRIQIYHQNAVAVPIHADFPHPPQYGGAVLHRVSERWWLGLAGSYTRSGIRSVLSDTGGRIEMEAILDMLMVAMVTEVDYDAAGFLEPFAQVQTGMVWSRADFSEMIAFSDPADRPQGGRIDMRVRAPGFFLRTGLGFKFHLAGGFVIKPHLAYQAASGLARQVKTTSGTAVVAGPDNKLEVDFSGLLLAVSAGIHW